MRSRSAPLVTAAGLAGLIAAGLSGPGAGARGWEGEGGSAAAASEVAAPGTVQATGGDGRVTVTFAEVEGGSVDGYRVYFSTCDFDAGPCAGESDPASYVDPAGAASPLEVDAAGAAAALRAIRGGDDDTVGDDDSAGDDDTATGDDDTASDDDTVTGDDDDPETLAATVSPLTNGETYFLAVAAVQDGAEGDWTPAVSATTGATGGWAALAGDDGASCGECSGAATSGGAAPSLLLLSIGYVLSRRGRGPGR